MHIVLFLVFQVAAHLLFKWGSTAPQYYWWGFGLGNLVGMSSIIFMLGMFKALPSSSVLAIGTGGAFVLNQIALFLVYREKMSIGTIIGIAMITAGILCAAYCGGTRQTTESNPAEFQEQ